MVMEQRKKEGHSYRQFMFALLANMTTLSYGLESGWVSPITKLLQSDSSPTGKALSDNELTWIASAMSFAAVFGVLIFSYITERYGCKRSVILLSLPQALSWILRIVNSSTASIIAARILSGISAGGIFNVVPMYVKEISQDETRGVLSSLIVLSQNIGMFSMYLMGAYLEYYTVMQLSVGLPIFAAVLMIKAPESPVFLVKQGKMEEAAQTIASLRGMDQHQKVVQNEIDYMRNEDALFKSLPAVSMISILKEKSWRRGVIIMFVMFTFYSLNGTFTILTYASAILASTEEYDISPELQTLSLPIVMIVASILLTVIIDRFRRKVLAIGAFCVIAVSMATLGGGMLVQHLGGSIPGWLPVVAMISAVTAFAGALSPIPYLITTEMFHFQILNKVMGAVVTYAWLSTCIAIAIFSPISNAYGQYTVYFVYAACNLIGAVFVAVFIPETKGKNSEEIRLVLSGRAKGDCQNST
ncbi:facilitated trehalose transporter Tret1-like [Aricia agestis]|uniref:facilitated trehalose transporter Tret1-like n=1 Tax=Aricia agestis TaxID=91739 RepID=UPI001C207A92|nr:facilitated trehalose transporter Tret1-like [Aricia agestis]